jgi:hypothetical protein
MFIFVGNLLYPACPECEIAMESEEMLDSNPPHHIWKCKCGYQEGYSMCLPMTEEDYHHLIRKTITQNNL